MARVVLVTGVSGRLGGRLADALQGDPGTERVIGVDAVPPRVRLGRTEFVRVDIRTSAIGKVIQGGGVDTVVDASLTAMPRGSGGRAPRPPGAPAAPCCPFPCRPPSLSGNCSGGPGWRTSPRNSSPC